MASSAWERRNEAARARGYRNYYDYRLHLYGARKPEEEIPAGQRMLRAGKRGGAAFRATLRHPEKIALILELPTGKHRVDGTYPMWRYVVTYTDGTIKEFVVRTETDRDLEDWRDEVEDSEVEFITYAKAEE